MVRTMEYRRKVRNKAITRKKRICEEIYGYDWYSCDGKYSKGKIYCGCSLCKFNRRYGLPTVRDIREIEKEKILI